MNITTQCTEQAVRHAIMECVQMMPADALQELAKRLLNAECYIDTEGQVAIEYSTQLPREIKEYFLPN